VEEIDSVIWGIESETQLTKNLAILEKSNKIDFASTIEALNCQESSLLNPSDWL